MFHFSVLLFDFCCILLNSGLGIFATFALAICLLFGSIGRLFFLSFFGIYFRSIYNNNIVFLAVFKNSFGHNHVFLLGALPGQVSHNKTLFHWLNRLSKLHHNKISSALFKASLILSRKLNTASFQGIFVDSARTSSTTTALSLLLFIPLLFLPLLSAILLSNLSFLDILNDILNLGWEVVTLHIWDYSCVSRFVRKIQIVHVC
mmetsp:Transcript_881/g.2037  ORF Transcript_881/g.2037 Transcript_881/m.2037 type:complete len:204 (+) Transcript_881:1638-2249(+)